jgi:DNA replication and repair protein RecF
MIVKEVSTINFRKLVNGQYSFVPGFNIIVGKNGSGKTSILDSIYLASTGKSFITSKNQNCINFNEEYFFISVEFQHLNRIEQVDYLLGRKSKELKLSGKKLRGFTEIIGKFPVLFLNYTLVDLVRGGPDEKRDFINHALIFIDKDYYRELIRYYSLLERRNSILRNNYKEGDYRELNPLSSLTDLKEVKSSSSVLIDTLSEEMVEVGRKIIEKRRKALKNIESIVRSILPQVLEDNCSVTLKYTPSKIDNLLSDSSVREEIIKRRTLFGIHLDEIEVILNDRGIRDFSSLGEAYGIGFALKLAENELIKSSVNKTPVLLVDDFFTDLDEIKRERILQIVQNEQIILTSISLSEVPQNIINKSKVIFL